MKISILSLLIVFLSLSSFSVRAGLDFEAVFNEPGLHGQANTTIEDKFLTLLNMAAPGSEVLLNIYGLRLPSIAKELVKAQARGIKVGVILRKFGDERSKESLKILKEGTESVGPLGKCSFGPCLKACGIGCSAPAFNHNKFYLFSELKDGTKDVVVHTSNNFWDEERSNFNDFLIIRNNAALYKSLRTYWITLYRGNKNPGLPEMIASNIKLHIFPKRPRSVDPVLKLIQSVQCIPGASIHIAHSRFTDPRSYIADALRALKVQGCDVKLLIKNDVGHERLGPIMVSGDSPGPKVISKLGDILYLFPYEEPVSGTLHRNGDPKRNALHSKIILINAPMKGASEFQKIVVVGTHNLDVPSFKLNNEIMMEIKDDRLYEEYESTFQKLLKSYMDLSPQERVACPRSGCISH